MANWLVGNPVLTPFSQHSNILVRRPSLGWLACIACFIYAAPIDAIELVGRVVDNAQARVFSNATVQVRRNTEKSREALSNTEGFFRLSNVSAGAYIIDISLADGRSFMTRLMINPNSTTQFIELDYSRIVTPDDDEDY